jgi:hypothetical protein
MVSRLSYYSLYLQLYGSSIRTGTWVHIASGIEYNVWPMKVIDERTCTPMVVYSSLDKPPIVWVRNEDEFCIKFTKKD